MMIISDLEMLKKVLDETLNIVVSINEEVKICDNPYIVDFLHTTNTDLLRISTNISHHVTGTQMKEKNNANS